MTQHVLGNAVAGAFAETHVYQRAPGIVVRGPTCGRTFVVRSRGTSRSQTGVENRVRYL